MKCRRNGSIKRSLEDPQFRKERPNPSVEFEAAACDRLVRISSRAKPADPPRRRGLLRGNYSGFFSTLGLFAGRSPFDSAGAVSRDFPASLARAGAVSRDLAGAPSRSRPRGSAAGAGVVGVNGVALSMRTFRLV